MSAVATSAAAEPVAAAELRTPGFFVDPYPVYARLRAQPGPLWLPHDQQTASRGVWLFSRHAEALQIFKETGAISKNLVQIRTPGTSSPFDLHVLHRDGADHLRLRRMVAQPFGPAAIRPLEARIADEARELLQALRRQGGGDLVRDFAELLPLRVIAGMFGLPPSDMRAVRDWTLALIDGFDSTVVTPEILQRQKEATVALLGYLGAALRDPPPDGLLRFLADERAAGRLSQDEMLGMAAFLLVAGHETTVTLIGAGLWLLLRHPEQWAMLQADRGLLGGAIEEILRYESPEQRTSFRIVSQPLRIGDTELQPGQQIGVVIGAANRDEAAFADAHRFDIRRDPNPHVAFGVGIHHCLGKTLARTEARVALGAVLDLVPGLALAGAPEWRRNSFFRSPTSLPVQVR